MIFFAITRGSGPISGRLSPQQEFEQVGSAIKDLRGMAKQEGQGNDVDQRISAEQVKLALRAVKKKAGVSAVTV